MIYISPCLFAYHHHHHHHHHYHRHHCHEHFCQAENMVGTRSSDVARLSVHVKPAFIEDPEDVTAREGDNVSLHCKVACVLYLLIHLVTLTPTFLLTYLLTHLL